MLLQLAVYLIIRILNTAKANEMQNKQRFYFYLAAHIMLATTWAKLLVTLLFTT
jgi:hypothetical protein